MKLIPTNLIEEKNIKERNEEMCIRDRSLNAYIDRLPARRIRYEPFIFLYAAGNCERLLLLA